MLGRKIARHGLILVATALLGGFLSAVLVRLAPGFDTDEAALDPHLNSQSIQALHQDRAELMARATRGPWNFHLVETARQHAVP